MIGLDIELRNSPYHMTQLSISLVARMKSMGFTTLEASREILYIKKGKLFAIQLTTDEDVPFCFTQLKQTVYVAVWTYSIYVTNESLESLLLLILMASLKARNMK